MKLLHNIPLYAAFTLLASLPSAAQRVEYFWDTDPGVGRATVLQQFSGTEADIATDLNTASLSPGIHVLGLRALNDVTVGKDRSTYHSATYHRQFYVPVPEESITRIEYYWDRDPGVGKGHALSFTDGSTVDLTQKLSASGLAAGMHTLYMRAVSTRHHSLTYTRQFYVPPTAQQVQAVEYWIDDDPGVGQATRMAATLTGDSLVKAFDVPVDGLSEGIHHIGLRTLTGSTWSATKVRQFLVRSQEREDYITRLEYFWNIDPGQGRAYAVDITPGEEVTIDFEADMTMLGGGPHTLGLRAQSGSQGWSPVKYVTGIEFEGWDNLQDYLNSLNDTEDQLTSTQYTRQYGNNDWHSLYVPFTLSFQDWQLHFDVARINAFYQYDDDEDGVVDRQVLEAIIVRGGTLKANYPYLIRARQKGTFSFPANVGRVEQKVNSYSCSTMEARYTFTGNYTDLKGLKSAQRYRLRGSSLSIPDSDDEVLPPYRWYLTIDNLGNQLQPSASRSLEVHIVGEEEAQGIYDLHFTQSDNDAEIVNNNCYDLQGRKVEDGRMKKGIYIINNKKHVVK